MNCHFLWQWHTRPGKPLCRYANLIKWYIFRSIKLFFKITILQGWPETGSFLQVCISRAYDDTEMRSNPYITNFNTVSRVRLLSWILSQLNMRCSSQNHTTVYYAKNNHMYLFSNLPDFTEMNWSIYLKKFST